MSYPYSPIPTALGATITLPNDGDANVAASVNLPLEDLADALALLQSGSALRILSHNFVVSGEDFTAPAIVAPFGILMGWGGGGGGGNGDSGENVANAEACGGGGGGGSLLCVRFVSLVSGTAYKGLVGAAGAGGAQGPVTNHGTAGGDTIFRIAVGAELSRFSGAQGGRSGATPNIPVGQFAFAPGGLSVNGGYRASLFVSTIQETIVSPGPACGGDGITSSVTRPRTGGRNPHGNIVVDNAGINGANGLANYIGGGAGGGGGQGPTGYGTAGGNGGAGNSVGAGGVGIGGGSIIVANTGSGGGGGGAGGAGTTGGLGGAGDNGSAGSLTLFYFTKVV